MNNKNKILLFSGILLRVFYFIVNCLSENQDSDEYILYGTSENIEVLSKHGHWQIVESR